MDHRVWKAEPEPELSDRLGWLGLTESMPSEVVRLEELAQSAIADGITQVVLCGMGGSSLASEVYLSTFGPQPGFPALTVVDSTHPDEVSRVAKQVDPAATLYVISSKSGGTLETLSLFRAFWALTENVMEAPGRQFVAITDPGSQLAELASERGFRDVFLTPPDVGGRYSAFTFFGLVPAALAGVDVGRLLQRAGIMASACGPSTPIEANPGAVLGAVMGCAAQAGRDKATYLVSESLSAFPVWVEQLVAESTGKEDLGIVPVADEPVGRPSEYGDDRLILHIVVEGDADPYADLVEQLAAEGTPVVAVTAHDVYDLGQEMYRAEFATAMAGAVLGINPFNQPNVQQAKELAKQAMAGDLGVGDIPAVHPDDDEAIDRWLSAFQSGDYVGIQAYVPYGFDEELAQLRGAIRSVTHGATTSGYGPRFLHSTGQLHKGGANNGMFLQLVDEPENELAVPETDYTFNRLVRAQADGDHAAMVDRDRRVLRVNLGSDRAAGMRTLVETFQNL